jgi:integrase
VSVDIEDIASDSGHRVLRVRRKGGKVAKILLPAPVIARLDAYMATRDGVSHVPATVDASSAPRRRPLATRTGKRIYRAEVPKVIHRLAAAAGLPEELVLSPHSMRHTYASLSLDAGVELRDLQDAMGHADPRTTRRYDRNRNNLNKAPGNVLAGYLGVCR